MALIGKNNEEKIWNFLIEEIKNEYGVAGLMGNLQAESGLNPKNLQNSFEKKLGLSDEEYTILVDNGVYSDFASDGCGYGLCQWTYKTRKLNLLNFVKQNKRSIGDLEIQLKFLMKELSESYKSVLRGLIDASSIQEASDLVLTKFERPANQGESVKKKRASYGQKFYDKYSQKEESSMADYNKYINSTGTHYISNSGFEK